MLVEHIADTITRVLAPNPSLLTGKGTNTYIVRLSSGFVIIDPGSKNPKHIHRITQHSYSSGQVIAIAITHGHPDHVEGAEDLRHLTGAPILAWNKFGTPIADIEVESYKDIPQNFSEELEPVYTPGHRFDHLCFRHKKTSSVFVGDLVAGEGTVVIAPPEGNLLQYLDSLDRLLNISASSLLPGHGPVIKDTERLLKEYVRHRLEREQQILLILSRSKVTAIQSIVKNVYHDIPANLHIFAAKSVLAHLLKLEAEGRVKNISSDQSNWSLSEH